MSILTFLRFEGIVEYFFYFYENIIVSHNIYYYLNSIWVITKTV